jgi:uncharacterized protein (AIM24 family)
VESAYSVEQFVRRSREHKNVGERFAIESERMLRIDVDGDVWLRPGAAIAYRGDITFARRPTTEATSLSDAALCELAPVVRATGRGRLYCGHEGTLVRVTRLAGESMLVSWQDLLAFESSLQFEMTRVSHGLTLAAGGLIMMKLSGHGAFAVATHGEPLALEVEAGQPVSTDPHATLAWSGTLTPTLKTDLDWSSLFWHGGQEPFQMLFDGHGFVVVQPFKDRSRIPSSFHLLGAIRKLVAGF